MEKYQLKIIFFLSLILAIFLVFWLYVRKNAPPDFSLTPTFFISPFGDDSNPGLRPEKPLRTIQRGMDMASPGEIVFLLDGEYYQDFVSRRDGLKDAPIVIKGERSAIVKGGGGARIIEINHDYLHLQGFTVDGQYGNENSKEGYRDKLIYVQGRGERVGVNGLRIFDMLIKNAGGECVRLKYFATQNEIFNNEILNCGIYDFEFNAGGKNGEGIYIGTAPEQLNDGKNPTSDPDQSNNNRIYGNKIDTQGNECVDIKEFSSGNIVENNECSGQKDDKSAGMDSRGNGNIFRSNIIYDNEGAGVRLGGDTPEDGLNNEVYLNTIRNNRSGGIKIERMPQAEICGNVFLSNSKADFVGAESKKAKELYDQSCSVFRRAKIFKDRFLISFLEIFK